MQYPSGIKTVKSTNEFRFKEKGSEFIAFVSPAESENEIAEILESKRKQFHTASHNCFAYKALPDIEKYSDDGEPSGTAGIRIFNALQHFELTNLIVVVTRYFGGVKLGVGPLGKAYYNAAIGVLESAQVILKKNFSKFDLTYNFEHSKTIHHFLNTYNCVIKENKFEQNPVISFLIEPDNIIRFEEDLKNSTKGSSKLNLVEEGLFI